MMLFYLSVLVFMVVTLVYSGVRRRLMCSAKTRMGNVSTVYSYFLIGMHYGVWSIFHEKGLLLCHCTMYGVLIS